MGRAQNRFLFSRLRKKRTEEVCYVLLLSSAVFGVIIHIITCCSSLK